MKSDDAPYKRMLFSSGWLALILVAGGFVFKQFQGELSLEITNWKLAIAGLVSGVVASSPMVFIVRDYLLKSQRPHRHAISFVLTFLPAAAKYIPGKIWSVAGFLHQAKFLAGISAKDASFSQVYLQITGLVSSAALSLAGLICAFIWLGDVPFRNDLIQGVILLLLAGGFAIAAMLKIAAKLGHQISRRSIPRHLWMLSLQKILKGMSLFLFVCAFMPAQGHLFEIMFAFIISMQLGVLAFFAPAGIGVVEGAYVFLLSGTVSAASALSIALIARIWQTGLDFLLALAAFIVKSVISGQSRSNTSG